MKDGYYWFTSERASSRAIGQHINGLWYLIGEEKPVTIEELNRRGWDLGKWIKKQDKV